LGDPTVLEAGREGESRASLEAPPPLLEVAPPLCVAVGKVAAEEASCEAECGAMVLVLEDSSWLGKGCCPTCDGEKSEEDEEAADDLRLPTCLAEEGGNAGKLEVAGEAPGRGPLGEGVLRCSCAIAVEMGGRRVLWCCREEPQGCCWLI
jgi:hypothetical protein